MRLIDADSLECDTEWDDYYDGFLSYSKAQIDAAPTIDMKQFEHGSWIIKTDNFHTGIPMKYAECSNCGHTESVPIAERQNYCPKCGFKMDGGNTV